MQQLKAQQMKTKTKNKTILEDSTESSDREVHAKQADITHLVSDINKSLDNYSPSNQDIPPNDDPNDEEEIEDIDSNKSRFCIPEWLKEPLLILLIYIILSQNFTKVFIGKYIKYINPSTDGTVSFLGVVIYGTILAVLYIILKKLLFSS